jgi:hypothetical protein
LESLGKTGASMMVGPAANLAVPYVETAGLKLGHLGRELTSRHATDTKYVEFDILPGTTASVSVNPGKVEIVVPLNRHLLSAQPIDEDIHPVLVKLDVNAKDQVRVIAARHIDSKQEKKNRLDLKPQVHRIEEGVEETDLPVSFERLQGNVYRIVNTDALTVGEYAVVFRRKGESGRYTANLALKTTAPEVQGQCGSSRSLAERMRERANPTASRRVERISSRSISAFCRSLREAPMKTRLVAGLILAFALGMGASRRQIAPRIPSHYPSYVDILSRTRLDERSCGGWRRRLRSISFTD